MCTLQKLYTFVSMKAEDLNIKANLKARGFSIKLLSELTGTTKQNMGQRLKTPSLDTLLKVAEATGLTLDEITGMESGRCTQTLGLLLVNGQPYTIQDEREARRVLSLMGGENPVVEDMKDHVASMFAEGRPGDAACIMTILARHMSAEDYNLFLTTILKEKG